MEIIEIMTIWNTKAWIFCGTVKNFSGDV